MAKKSLEAAKLLEALSIEQLGALHAFSGDKLFSKFVSVLNHIILLDKEKQVGLVSDTNSVDDAISQASKQNFYRGRISSLVLIHSLLKNAENELEIRERKSNASTKVS